MRWAIALICGFLIWVVPATIDSLLYSYMSSLMNILDTFILVGLLTTAIACTVRYFKTTEGDFLMEGVEIGALWFFMAIALGLITAVVFPAYIPRVGAEATIYTFIMGIGVFFLLVPTITIAFGYILEKKMLAR